MKKIILVEFILMIVFCIISLTAADNLTLNDSNSTLNGTADTNITLGENITNTTVENITNITLPWIILKNFIPTEFKLGDAQIISLS
jgi:hypothetical protein